MRSKRLGLLGGTFNPVHRGHIDLGSRVRDAFGLDEVLYILSARPPHKKEHGVVSMDLRWKMLNEALSPFPYLVPSDIEMNLPHDSWTVVTVETLQKQHPDHRFYFISGSEGFLKIRTWKQHKKLLSLLPFIVVLRDESHRPMVMELLESEDIPLLAEPADRVYDEPPGAFIFKYDSDKLFISSTLIRNQVKSSAAVDSLVETKVKKIMEENKLYEN